MALYSTTAATTLQTLQFGTYIPGNLVMGSPTADTMLVLANPLDLNSNVAGTNVQFSSIRGTTTAKLPEGDYAGAIGNSGSAAVNVTFGSNAPAGNGSLLFSNSASSFNAASLQLAGGGLLIGANDYANNSQTGPLGMGTAALTIGVAGVTNSAANLSFLTYGPNSRVVGSSPTLSTNRNIVVTGVPNGSVVLGGYTDDYTAMNGSVTLNGPVTFFAAQSGRVDFTGPISSSGAVAVQIGGTAYTGGTSSNGFSSNGISLGGLGTDQCRERHDRLHRLERFFRDDDRRQRPAAGERVAVCLFQRDQHGHRGEFAKSGASHAGRFGHCLRQRQHEQRHDD